MQIHLGVFNRLECKRNYSATSNNEVGTLADDEWAVAFGTTRPLHAVSNVTVHPSTASVPVSVLLYNGPLLCGFTVSIRLNPSWAH